MELFNLKCRCLDKNIDDSEIFLYGIKVILKLLTIVEGKKVNS